MNKLRKLGLGILLAGTIAANGCLTYFVATNADHDCKQIIEVDAKGSEANVLFRTSNGIKREPLDVGECARNTEARMSENKCGVHIKCIDSNNHEIGYYRSLESIYPGEQTVYYDLRQKQIRR